MKYYLKLILNLLSIILVIPLALTVWLETIFSKKSELFFQLWSQLLALVPGFPGIFLRRSFYFLVLDHCSLNCNIGFGTLFTHRKAVVEDNVSIGNYGVIGCVRIGPNCEIGSRVSILSGKHQHTKKQDGGWTPFDISKIKQITIASNVWVGEGAIIMADIEEGCLVGAGAVLTKPLPPNVVAAGNPAKILKTFNTN